MTPDDPGSAADRTVDGRYRLVRLLGDGGSGPVWLAHDALLDRHVAIRFLNAASDGSDAQSRFARAAGVHHANLAAIYDTGSDGGRPYVVMEYVSGNTLAEQIRQDGALDPETVRRLAGQVFAGLHAAHTAGVAHGAVTSANIRFTADGTAKLTDLGISRADGRRSEQTDVDSLAALMREVAGGETHPTILPSAAGPSRRRTVGFGLRLVLSLVVVAALGVVAVVLTSSAHKASSAGNRTAHPAASRGGARSSSAPEPSYPPLRPVASADPHRLISKIRLDGTYHLLTATPDGRRLVAIATNAWSDPVHPMAIIDLSTGSIRSVPLHGHAAAVAVTPDGSRILVSETGPHAEMYRIEVFAAGSGQLLSYTPVPPSGLRSSHSGGSVGQMAVSGDGRYAFIAETGQVAMVDLSAQRVVKRMDVGSGLGAIASSGDGGRLYVLDIYAQSVDVLDTQTEKIVAKRWLAIFGNGDAPLQGMLVAPGSGVVYAYGENDGRQPDVVGVVDTRTNAMRVEQLPAAVQSLWGFALNPNGRYLYVANSPLAPGGGGIVLLDTANWRSRTVVLHADPNGMAVSPDGRRLYVLEQTEIAVLG